MKPKYVTKSLQVGPETIEKNNWFGLGKKIKVSKKSSNREKLANDTETYANDMDAKGYDLISITPMIRGMTDAYSHDTVGAGWSVTDGVIITFKLRS